MSVLVILFTHKLTNWKKDTKSQFTQHKRRTHKSDLYIRHRIQHDLMHISCGFQYHDNFHIISTSAWNSGKFFKSLPTTLNIHSLQFRDYQTLTPCGHSEACRSSSRWRDQPRPGSQNGQRRNPWSRFHHTPPTGQGDAHRHDYEWRQFFHFEASSTFGEWRKATQIGFITCLDVSREKMMFCCFKWIYC